MKNINEWIDLLERELPMFHQGAAIKYIDGKHHGIWSKAQDEFQGYLDQGRGQDLAPAYFQLCIDWAKEYKADWIANNPGKEPPWAFGQNAYAVEATRYHHPEDRIYRENPDMKNRLTDATKAQTQKE